MQDALKAYRPFVLLALAACGAGACGGQSPAAPTPAPTPTPRLFPAVQGVVTDPAGDGSKDVPDLVSGAVEGKGDGTLKLTVRLTPGTFDRNTTHVQFEMDTDQNPATGGTAPNRSGGIDYVIDMGSAFYGTQAQVLRHQGGNSYGVVGAAPVAFLADGMEVQIPLSMLGNDDGRMNFRVTSQMQVSPNGFTGILDYMPDAPLPPGVVQ